MVDLQDLEAAAKARLHPDVHLAISRGVAGSVTFDDNLAAWRRLRLAPRILAGATVVDPRISLLGSEMTTPIALAPAGLPRNANSEGEAAAARGAARAGALMVLSHFATQTLEDVAAAAPEGTRWFQLYLTKDRGHCRELLVRARDSGYRAIVMTVDTGGGIALEGVPRSPDWDLQPMRGDGVLDASASFADIEWVKAASGLPAVIKGVLRADDARRCVAAGADAIVVSNHGGRALDGSVATADALPAIADEVGGEIEVYVDGGIRRGGDVVKAMALGARAVFIGQPWVWAVCAGDSTTVTALIRTLTTELVCALAMCGTSSLDEIDRGLIWR
jgi:4-hydroxymandelate oxidase